jgi:hypothetical protein
MKSKTYYTLCVCDPADGLWSAQAGDYEREVMRDEMEDYKYHTGEGCQWEKGSKFKIIATDDNQAAIDQYIAKLNNKS